MKHLRWQLLLGLVLVVSSILFYLIHYLIFRDAHHIFIYLIGDIAFVFFEVLLVTLIIHRVLNDREKRARLEKLNIVIGVFFSEVGTKMLASCPLQGSKLQDIAGELSNVKTWSNKEFLRVSKLLKGSQYKVDIQKANLEKIHIFLNEKTPFMLRLLENPILLEHESFTDLLLAVFHFSEELNVRDDLMEIPETDSRHLAGDMGRVYQLLMGQWLDYMKHLKDNYPFLFSFAIRTNPFDTEASPVVKE
ncbi:hypothetical protein ACFLZT_00175 [Thermodesulfobacteriota bacterium]